MDYQATQRLHRELSPGESLLWSGRPRQGILFRASDLTTIPFSILWTAFAIYWEYNNYVRGEPLFSLFGISFVVVGLYFVFGRFIVDALVRRGTYYGVTDSRILILTELPTRKTHSIDLRTLRSITFSNRSDGSGDIAFGPEQPAISWIGKFSWSEPAERGNPIFEGVNNVKAVYETIRDAQKKLT